MYTSNEYLKNNPSWHVEDSPLKAKQILKIINNNKLQPTSVCEIGCGAGEIFRQLLINSSEKISFCGYEISADAFELCKPRKTDRLDFKLANLLEDTSAYYDIVMAIDVIEHVEDYFGFLRLLKERGNYKIFHIPLDMTVLHVLRMSSILRYRKHAGHIHYFSKDTALETLKDTGYEIIDHFYTLDLLEQPSKSLKSRLMRFPRKIGFKANKNLTARILGGFSLMVLAR